MQLRGIKLALVDDAKALVTDFTEILSDIEQAGIAYTKAYEVIDMQGSMGLELFNDAKNVVDKLEAAYKALGVDPRLSNEYKKLIQQMDTLLTYRKRYNF
jgi:L-rhamnose isomerase